MYKVYTVQELQEILTPIFQQNGVKQAILFGSYAKGLATARSNIDLLVDSGLRGLAFFGAEKVQPEIRARRHFSLSNIHTTSSP